jgi:hypothetical protein
MREVVDDPIATRTSWLGTVLLRGFGALLAAARVPALSWRPSFDFGELHSSAVFEICLAPGDLVVEPVSQSPFLRVRGIPVGPPSRLSNESIVGSFLVVPLLLERFVEEPRNRFEKCSLRVCARTPSNALSPNPRAQFALFIAAVGARSPR